MPDFTARSARRRAERSLHPDLVLVLAEAGLAFQALGDEFRVLFGFEVRKTDAVDPRIADFRRNDLGRIAGLAQLVVDTERLAGFLRRADGDLPLARPGRHPAARLLLGFHRPFGEPVREDGL